MTCTSTWRGRLEEALDESAELPKAAWLRRWAVANAAARAASSATRAMPMPPPPADAFRKIG